MQTSFPAATDHGPSVIRWSAIAAGAVVALGVMATLYALGVSAGLAAFDIEIPGRARHVGVFLGAFGVIITFVALFFGGFVAARAASASTKAVGFLHGLTMWGVSALALLWITYASVAAATRGVVYVGQGVAQAGQSMLRAGGSALSDGLDGLKDIAKDAGKQVQEHVSVDPDAALQAVNAKLKEKGKGPLTREQIERTLKRIADDVLHQKDLNRGMVIDAVSRECSVTKEDAAAVADDLTRRFEDAKKEMQQHVDAAKNGLEEARQTAEAKLEKAANEVAESVSKAFGALSLALVLGLVAAGGGAALAASRQS